LNPLEELCDDYAVEAISHENVGEFTKQALNFDSKKLITSCSAYLYLRGWMSASLSSSSNFLCFSSASLMVSPIHSASSTCKLQNQNNELRPLFCIL
jgi:hypothetical protein